MGQNLDFQLDFVVVVAYLRALYAEIYIECSIRSSKYQMIRL